MKNIVLIGGGDFAKKIIKLIEKIGSYNIVGYTDNVDRGSLFNVKYLGDDKRLKKIIEKYPNCAAVVTMSGNIKLLPQKRQLIKLVKELGFHFPILISPSAYIDKSSCLKEGCVIFDKVYIDFGVDVGAFSVINLCSTIGHDTKIGQIVTISPETITGGGSKIGNNSFTGINSTINPYVKIVDNTIIGSGSVVIRDITESGIYVGNPAKKIKSL